MNIFLETGSWVKGNAYDSAAPNDATVGQFGYQGSGNWLAFSRLTEPGDTISADRVEANNTGSSDAPWLLVVASSTKPGEGELSDIEVVWSGQGYEQAVPSTDLPAGKYIYIQATSGAPEPYYMGSYYSLGPIEFSPLVANDDEATTNVDTPVTVDVLANDTLGGAPVELSDLIGPPVITVEPEEGEVVVEGDGSITYSPPEGFSGEVTFEYEIETEEDQGCVEFGFASCSANDEINEGPLQTIQAEAPWLDYMAPFTITTPEWEADYEWGGTSALKFFETGTTPDLNSVGSGTLTQNGNSICVEWFAGCA